jgi:hypothetical protein
LTRSANQNKGKRRGNKDVKDNKNDVVSGRLPGVKKERPPKLLRRRVQLEQQTLDDHDNDDAILDACVNIILDACGQCSDTASDSAWFNCVGYTLYESSSSSMICASSVVNDVHVWERMEDQCDSVVVSDEESDIILL